MRMKKLAALLAALLAASVLSAFGPIGLAAMQRTDYTVDLTGDGEVPVPQDAVEAVLRNRSLILLQSNNALSLDFNGDGQSDAAVLWKDAACFMKRLPGMDRLSENVAFSFEWGPYTSVTFKVIEPVTGIRLNRKSLKLTVGSRGTLVATVTPQNATRPTVKWKSSKPAVAKVDASGRVTARAAGTATVTAIAEDGGWKAACKVVVSREKTRIVAKKATSTVINSPMKYTCALRDEQGNPVRKATLALKVNGRTYRAKTNAKGSVTLKLKFAKTGKYTVRIRFAGNKTFKPANRTVSISVVRGKVRIIAKNKSFKKAAKARKYTCVLRNKNGKPLKGVQVTLKVNGKTYKAKTNAKGKATFNLKKLTQKGKYTATIRFAGNKSYNAATKKVRIAVK